MNASGLCDICGKPDVDHVCDRCGRLVCERHYDDGHGVCTECATELGLGDEHVDPDDLPNDVDIYRF
ncbi:hypothetical protein [Halapricum hydrolyticum]|uniref:HIT-type domain-containing protein n=1 Tax=Halapricum hydrolyticum TaxID=2979991 RepID=A0AAE3I8V2_9EURY|nr:hypothetical protein [Halapricum hydrolyticum]MCU4716476.1 hypothetical protein [Halapricum hydrolyticum]MCU4725920.1 hypothetical protein [Halapricum hydrolyticum]